MAQAELTLIPDSFDRVIITLRGGAGGDRPAAPAVGHSAPYERVAGRVHELVSTYRAVTSAADGAAPCWAENKATAAVSELVEMMDALTEHPARTIGDVGVLLDAADTLMSALYRTPEVDGGMNYLGDPLWDVICAARRAVRENVGAEARPC